MKGWAGRTFVPGTDCTEVHKKGKLGLVMRYRVSFPQTATFSGKLGNYLFMVSSVPGRAVPGTFYKFMQVFGVERVRKLFVVKEIEVLKFWDGIRGILALDARKYKF